MICIDGKVQGNVIGDGKTITNTFAGGKLVNQTVSGGNGRTAEEIERRRAAVLAAGGSAELAEFYAALYPVAEEAGLQELARNGIYLEDA
jgi:hypothetical protein